MAIMRVIAQFFDSAWYAKRYPDVAAAKLDPLQHFLRYGLLQGRDPNQFFDSAWYDKQNPDVRVTGLHPLMHYLRYGGPELRNPNARFDAAWYAAQHPDSAANPLVYHVTIGRALGYPTEEPSYSIDFITDAPTRRTPVANGPSNRQTAEGPVEKLTRLGGVDPVALFEDARMAEESADWRTAEQLWETLKSAFPQTLKAHIGLARALRAQGRLDEARAVLEHAVEQFPAKTDPLHELARLAEAREDWASAERAWQQHILLDATVWGSHAGLAAALRRQDRLDEAEAAIAIGGSRCPHDPAITMERARVAQLRGDWVSALSHWNAVFADWPDRWESFHGRATALLHLNRKAEAHDTLEAALRRFPTQVELLHDYARLAEDKRHWAAAEHAWRSFIAVKPQMGWAHTALASALLKQDRAQEAEATLEAALRELPSDPDIVAAHAQAIHRRTGPAEAANDHRSDQAETAAPKQALPGLEEAHAWNRRLAALINERRFAEFEATWTSVPEPLQTDLGIMSLWCVVPRLTRDWPEALRRSIEMAEKWPDSSTPLAHRIHAIAGLLGYAEAERAIATSLKAHDKAPDILQAAVEVMLAARNCPLVIEYAQRLRNISGRFYGPGVRYAVAIAHHESGNFVAAAAEISAGLSAYPGDPLLTDAARAWSIPEPEIEPPYILPELVNPRSSYVVMRGDAEIEALTGLAPRELVVRFDTIGENCEFGFIQRAVGAEPISLMRFAGMRWEEMTFALDQNFDGIDRPDNLMPKDEAGTWDMRDRLYNIAYHTFLPVATNPEPRLVATEARRLRWLADKLIDDLKNGDKAFVAWRARAEDPRDIIPLFRAIRRHGNATIIMVDAGEGDPGVEEIAPGLLRGRVGQLVTPDGHPRDVEGWLAMLGNAWLLLRPPSDGTAKAATAEDETAVDA